MFLVRLWPFVKYYMPHTYLCRIDNISLESKISLQNDSPHLVLCTMAYNSAILQDTQCTHLPYHTKAEYLLVLSIKMHQRDDWMVN